MVIARILIDIIVTQDSFVFGRAFSLLFVSIIKSVSTVRHQNVGKAILLKSVAQTNTVSTHRLALKEPLVWIVTNWQIIVQSTL